MNARVFALGIGARVDMMFRMERGYERATRLREHSDGLFAVTEPGPDSPCSVVPDVSDLRQRLVEDLASKAVHIGQLEFEHGRIIAASEASNADDEHDPEGATIAFERQQLGALLQQARRSGEDLKLALGKLDEGRYGGCERCGGPIAAERLAARPTARTCIRCAT